MKNYLAVVFFGILALTTFILALIIVGITKLIALVIKKEMPQWIDTVHKPWVFLSDKATIYEQLILKK